MMMNKVAILTMDHLSDFECYDQELDRPMEQAGWKTSHISWHDSNVNWDDYQVVIIRSPWDYQQDFKSFLKVLETIDLSSARLENSLDLVKWNINKTYLQELERSGLNIVSTYWLDNYSSDHIEQCFDLFSCSEIIIKPVISANADHTYRLTKQQWIERKLELKSALGDRALMIQPFIEKIVSEGEFSFFYFNGRHSHSILKKPCDGDFRVQEEHGGIIVPFEATQDQLQFCENTLKALPTLPLYARIDLVRENETYAIMEVELIEPSLYFNKDPRSADRFVAAFVELLES